MFNFNTKTGEMLLYGVVGESWFDDGLLAKDVSDVLDKMNGKRVTVRINSPGGVADEGIAIYQTLKRYKGGIDTVVDSLAASAASIVALAGETRTTLTGSRWMIHNAMGVGIGNASDMRKLADILDIYDSSLADIYSQTINSDKDAILTMMGAETWFDANSAVELGLATHLENTKATEPQQMAAWFNHPPADLLEQQATAKMKPLPVARELARMKLRLQESKKIG